MNFHELISELEKINSKKNSDLQTALVLLKMAISESPLDPSTYKIIKKFLEDTK